MSVLHPSLHGLAVDIFTWGARGCNSNESQIMSAACYSGCSASCLAYVVSAKNGWPGVSILLLDEIANLFCNFYLGVAAC